MVTPSSVVDQCNLTREIEERGAALPTAGGHATVPGRRGRLRLSVRHKLTLFSTLVILAVSSGFTWVSLGLARRAIE